MQVDTDYHARYFHGMMPPYRLSNIYSLQAGFRDAGVSAILNRGGTLSSTKEGEETIVESRGERASKFWRCLSGGGKLSFLVDGQEESPGPGVPSSVSVIHEVVDTPPVVLGIGGRGGLFLDRAEPTPCLSGFAGVCISVAMRDAEGRIDVDNSFTAKYDSRGWLMQFSGFCGPGRAVPNQAFNNIGSALGLLSWQRENGRAEFPTEDDYCVSVVSGGLTGKSSVAYGAESSVRHAI